MALSRVPTRYAEASPLVAALIAALGLAAGLAVSTAVRGAVLALPVLAAGRFPRLRWPLFVVAALGIGYTALLAAGNLSLLAQ